MELLAFVIGALLGLLLCIPMLIGYGVSFVLEGIAFTKFAKTRSIKNLWLAWIPCVEYVGKKYLMSQLSDETGYRFFGFSKTIKNRLLPFWIYLAIYCCNMLLSYVAIPFTFIPVVGTILSILEMIFVIPVMFVLFYIELGYFRDVLETYKPGCSSNATIAALVVLGNFFTFGLVRAIYLFILSNKQGKAAEE